MSPSMVAALPAVLPVFALLFSNRWIGSWQKKWAVQMRAHSAAPASAPPGASRKKRQKKKPGPTKNDPAQPQPQERFYDRIFSLRVTLWYLIFQRLNFDQTLAAVVTDLREGGADHFSRRGRKLSRKVRSTKTSAYNQARQRLPLALLQAALAQLGQHLLKLVGLAPAAQKRPAPGERTRQLLDGSTLASVQTSELAAEYPPASNQNGASDWSLMRILVGFCARSGAVLSAVEGPMQRGEQALAWTVIEAAAAFTIWIGDRNFGVWSMAAQAVRHRQDVLVRLTKSRAAKLARGCPLPSGEDRPLQCRPAGTIRPRPEPSAPR